MFNNRKWTEVSRTFTPPINRAVQGTAMAVQKAAYGFTTIELREARSGELKFETVIGDQTIKNSTPQSIVIEEGM